MKNFVTLAVSAVSAWIGEFLLLSALWGSSFLFARLGADEFGPLPTAGLCVCLATLFLWPLMLRQGQWPALQQQWRPILASGVLNSALPYTLSAWAVLHLATGLTSILNATAALFGALVAWAWLGDRIHGLRWLGLLCGFTGVALLSWDGGLQAAGSYAGWAIVASLLASLCYGVAASFARRYLRNTPALATAAGGQLGASLALALPTWLYWPAQTPSLHAWLAVAAMAVLSTAIAYILYFRLIARIGASRAIAATLLAPVFAMLYGKLFLHEAVTSAMVGCGLIILLGTLLSMGWLELPRAARATAKTRSEKAG